MFKYVLLLEKSQLSIICLQVSLYQLKKKKQEELAVVKLAVVKFDLLEYLLDSILVRDSNTRAHKKLSIFCS